MLDSCQSCLPKSRNTSTNLKGQKDYFMNFKSLSCGADTLLMIVQKSGLSLWARGQGPGISSASMNITLDYSLRSRCMKVVGERENGRARGRHTCLLLARPFFLVPTTSKRLLRRLCRLRRPLPNRASFRKGQLALIQG